MIREPGQDRRPTEALDESQVAAYLAGHPDFLAGHPELLARLTPPEADYGRGVVDFQVYLAERLRDRLGRLEARQRELIGTTRANHSSQARVHAAVLALLEARTLEQFVQVVVSVLTVVLDLDVAGLAIEASGNLQLQTTGIRILAPGTVEARFGHEEIRLAGDIIGDEAIHGPLAGLVRSEALIRLKVSDKGPEGALTFGSRHPDSFHQGQGTELITFLGRVVERRIADWLDMTR